MKIYLSGKINGLPREEVDIRFGDAFWQVARLYDEASIVNPSKLDEMYPGRSYEFYMAESLKLLLECEEVWFLRGWEKSRGANLEMQVASACGIRINFL